MKIHQNKYNLESKFFLKSKVFQAFTLVELIVVIVILAILATIAFLSFNNYSTSARDSDRLSDMTNITKWLSVLYTTSWVYPIPDNHITITAWTWYLIYQWTAWTKTLNTIKMSEAKDYLDNTYYSYSTDKNRIQYSIWWYLENKPNAFNWFKNWNNVSILIKNNIISARAGIYSLLSSQGIIWEVNAIDYSKRYLLIKWWIVWILTESWTNYPVEQTTTLTWIDLLTSSKNLILNTSSTTSTVWTWLIVWVIQSNQNWWYSYTAPTSCPDWFIPVQWNPDFNQPWFCVAKYEMKQTLWDAGSWNWTAWALWPVWTSNNPYCTNTIPCNNTWWTATITTKWAIISKPDWYPIVWLNQYNAIEACKSMWNWYHLITNNEWMAIARNIEVQSSNWSWWIVWTTLNRWQSNANWTDWNIWALTANTWIYGSPNNWFINKRTHNLSNWQIIWDIAGNVWEHVNKANTLDWSNYAIWTNWINFMFAKTADNDICNATDWFYEWSTCVSKAISMNWPANSSYTTTNWIWGVRDYDATIIARGSAWGDTASVGIFALFLAWNNISSSYNNGFRCAK